MEKNLAECDLGFSWGDKEKAEMAACCWLLPPMKTT